MCEMFKPGDVVEHLGHFSGIVCSLLCILTKQHGVHSGKYPRCLSPQELVPSVQIPKPPTIHYQPAT